MHTFLWVQLGTSGAEPLCLGLSRFVRGKLLCITGQTVKILLRLNYNDLLGLWTRGVKKISHMSLLEGNNLYTCSKKKKNPERKKKRWVSESPPRGERDTISLLHNATGGSNNWCHTPGSPKQNEHTPLVTQDNGLVCRKKMTTLIYMFISSHLFPHFVYVL